MPDDVALTRNVLGDAMRTRTAAITAALLLALTACDSSSEGDDKPAAEPSRSPSTSAATTPEPTATETRSIRADFKVGQEASNYGTIVTINKVQEANTITINKHHQAGRRRRQVRDPRNRCPQRHEDQHGPHVLVAHHQCPDR